MISVQDVVKELCKMGISITVEYNSDKDMLYYDLNTMAKSHLHLYEDFTVLGRYDYKNKIDSDQEINEILKDLFWEFEGCIHGRDFCNTNWKEIGVSLGCINKKVETYTETKYY